MPHLLLSSPRCPPVRLQAREKAMDRECVCAILMHALQVLLPLFYWPIDVTYVLAQVLVTYSSLSILRLSPPLFRHLPPHPLLSPFLPLYCLLLESRPLPPLLFLDLLPRPRHHPLFSPLLPFHRLSPSPHPPVPPHLRCLCFPVLLPRRHPPSPFPRPLLLPPHRQTFAIQYLHFLLSHRAIQSHLSSFHYLTPCRRQQHRNFLRQNLTPNLPFFSFPSCV